MARAGSKARPSERYSRMCGENIVQQPSLLPLRSDGFRDISNKNEWLAGEKRGEYIRELKGSLRVRH